MLAVPEWMGQEHVIFCTCGYHLWPLCSLLMAICGLKGRGCLFKRILSCLDCIFFIKNVYTFSFFSLSFAFYCLGSFFRRGMHFICREHMLIHMSHLELLCQMFWSSCWRPCHHTCVLSLWLHHAAEGDLTHACPAWRPVCEHSCLPFESCFFTSVPHNNCKLLFQRSQWFIPAMSLAEGVSQPSDSLDLC